MWLKSTTTKQFPPHVVYDFNKTILDNVKLKFEENGDKRLWNQLFYKSRYTNANTKLNYFIFSNIECVIFSVL